MESKLKCLLEKTKQIPDTLGTMIKCIEKRLFPVRNFP